MFTYSIDSLSLTVPSSIFTEIPDLLIYDCHLVVDNTGEIVTTKKFPFTVSENGINFRASKSLLFNMQTKTKTEFVFFTLTAKMLKKNYFKGFTNYTLPDLFDYLHSKGFKFSHFDFLNESKIFDVDFCHNFRMSSHGFDSLLTSFKGRSNTERYFQQPKTALKIGYQTSNRQDGRILTPFIKFYSKDLELQGNSFEFYENYLYPYDLSDLKRLECTVKNSRHFESLFKKLVLPTNVRTFGDLIDLKDYHIQNVIEYCLWSYNIGNGYYKGDFQPLQDDIDITLLTPIDEFILSLIAECPERQILLNKIDGLTCSPNSKTRLRKKIKYLFEVYKVVYSEKIITFDKINQAF